MGIQMHNVEKLLSIFGIPEISKEAREEWFDLTRTSVFVRGCLRHTKVVSNDVDTRPFFAMRDPEAPNERSRHAGEGGGRGWFRRSEPVSEGSAVGMWTCGPGNLRTGLRFGEALGESLPGPCGSLGPPLCRHQPFGLAERMT